MRSNKKNRSYLNNQINYFFIVEQKKKKPPQYRTKPKTKKNTSLHLSKDIGEITRGSSIIPKIKVIKNVFLTRHRKYNETWIIKL
jgi:ABC-type phosphate/phosphonate transport system ATPase subunit